MNMKNTKYFGKASIGKIVLAMTILATACSSLGGFSRGQAVTAIAADNGYRTPSVTSIDVGWMTNTGAQAWQISADDTAEEAAIRVKEDFKTRQPQLLAAEHLGLIKLYFENAKLGPTQIDMPSELFNKKLGVWNFKVRAEITDAGRELWEDAGLGVTELALPLGVRGTPEITGITDESQTMKKVEFTYFWKPTPLGAALDPNNAAFVGLPQDLQDILKSPKRDLFVNNSKITNVTSPRKGFAYFKKFDDGWRMHAVTLL